MVGAAVSVTSLILWNEKAGLQSQLKLRAQTSAEFLASQSTFPLLIGDRDEITGGHVPILALIAHAMKEYEERCYRAGMDGFLTKPLLPQQLYEAVESAVAEE